MYVQHRNHYWCNYTRVVRTRTQTQLFDDETYRPRAYKHSERAEECRFLCCTTSYDKRSTEGTFVHFRFGLPTNLKLATCAAISRWTPLVPQLVGMTLLLLAVLTFLSGVSGIWHLLLGADWASIANWLLWSCSATEERRVCGKIDRSRTVHLA